MIPSQKEILTFPSFRWQIFENNFHISGKEIKWKGMDYEPGSQSNFSFQSFL